MRVAGAAAAVAAGAAAAVAAGAAAAVAAGAARITVMDTTGTRWGWE
jgi:hypothetical protein